jgi:hypothetical protein
MIECKKRYCSNQEMMVHDSNLCLECYQNSRTYFKQRPGLKVLDLFSGFGGFSEAFLQYEDEVLRIENNPLLSEVPNTEIMCVLELRDELKLQLAKGNLEPKFLNIDLIVASPPCHEFSLAFNSPQGIASRNGGFDEYSPSMELIEATYDIIEILKPRYYIVENVRGSIRHFKKIGIEPNQIMKQTYVFYGKFPLIENKQYATKKEKDTGSQDPLRANKRAIIPFELSLNLRKAILNQKTIFDYGVI